MKRGIVFSKNKRVCFQLYLIITAFFLLSLIFSSVELTSGKSSFLPTLSDVFKVGKYDKVVNLDSKGNMVELASDQKYYINGKSDSPAVGEVNPISEWKLAGSGTHALLEGLSWAGYAYFAGTMIGDALGATEEQSESLGYSLGAGAFTYKAISTYSGFTSEGGLFLKAHPVGFRIILTGISSLF